MSEIGGQMQLAGFTADDLASWWSPQHAADELGVTVRRVVQLCDARRLVYARTELGRLVSPDSVQARLNGATPAAVAPPEPEKRSVQARPSGKVPTRARHAPARAR